MFLKSLTKRSTENFSDEAERQDQSKHQNQLERLQQALDDAEAVIVGAGSGLSAAAGFLYSGERFERYFRDFAEKYPIRDIYSGGFYPFPTLEEYWAWWSRHIWVNRYMDAPKPVYDDLFALIRGKEYFVLTTNVDHCFQKAGFDKERLFYTQGDYGLFQCSGPCCDETFDNEDAVRGMIEAQGFDVAENNDLVMGEGGRLSLEIPSALVPYCPKCGRPMIVNLRSDNTFVEDQGWRAAQSRYQDFLRRYRGRKLLFLELGVGGNTPVIIKYPFWRMTAENTNAVYACINYGEAYAPEEIRNRSICINGDIREVLKRVR